MAQPRATLAVRVAALATLVVAVPAAGVGERAPQQAPCEPLATSTAYAQRVDHALRAKQDVWGNELLRAPAGPTYEGAARYLAPLLLARAPKQTALTTSGVHYLAFGRPGRFALHVADGSQILARRAGGESLTVSVGRSGEETYGSCLARLETPRLADGYLPILRTAYVDENGSRYRQESFATLRAGSLVSMVRLDVNPFTAVEVRFTPSRSGAGLTYAVPDGSTRTLYVAFSRGRATAIEAASYDRLRAAEAAYWRRRLAEGASIDVPERRVHDAARALLIQDLLLAWRYSVGNPYEQFSFPEGVDVAQVLSSWGFRDVARRMLETSFHRRPRPYPNWKRGQKLVGVALHSRLFRDGAFVARATPVLRAYVDALVRQLTADPNGLLGRERYSSDIPDDVYGLHAHAVVWQGLESMARVWLQTGRPALAVRSRRLAQRLERSLRRAVARSQRRLPDGSLFLPARLLDGERPYDRLTTSRPGSYWNLVTPYALASGLFPRGSPEARGALRYMLRHGSRLLGLVRAGAFALYGKAPTYPQSGTDQVYGVNVARFLALNDRPDQLVLSLYGQLAAGMTPGTFASGEAASVAPIPGQYHRSMYLPPNSAANAAFLEALRLLLVHEPLDRSAQPHGLELAFATPRGWLAPGRRISVRRVPTSFGPLSFSVEAREADVRAVLDLPPRGRPQVSLRLRLPAGRRIVHVSLDGRRLPFSGETIRLPRLAGRHELVARVGS
jgi:hypothetical protein